MSGALDTHLSTVSNRLNVVMKQLTIIATIFLPLSFLTGFFGQNFGWMVTCLGSLAVFLGAGLGLQVLTVIALMVFSVAAAGRRPAVRCRRSPRPPVPGRRCGPGGWSCTPPRPPGPARTRASRR